MSIYETFVSQFLKNTPWTLPKTSYWTAISDILSTASQENGCVQYHFLLIVSKVDCSESRTQACCSISLSSSEPSSSASSILFEIRILQSLSSSSLKMIPSLQPLLVCPEAPHLLQNSSGKAPRMMGSLVTLILCRKFYISFNYLTNCREGFGCPFII